MRSLPECRRRPHGHDASCFIEFRQHSKKIRFFKVERAFKSKISYLSPSFKTRFWICAQTEQRGDERPVPRRRGRRRVPARGGGPHFDPAQRRRRGFERRNFTWSPRPKYSTKNCATGMDLKVSPSSSK